MNSTPSNPPSTPYASRFTSLSRVLCIVALATTIGVMYWVIYNSTVSGPQQLLAVGGVLMAGILVIATGAHFSDGRHRK